MPPRTIPVPSQGPKPPCTAHIATPPPPQPIVQQQHSHWGAWGLLAQPPRVALGSVAQSWPPSTACATSCGPNPAWCSTMCSQAAPSCSGSHLGPCATHVDRLLRQAVRMSGATGSLAWCNRWCAIGLGRFVWTHPGGSLLEAARRLMGNRGKRQACACSSSCW